MCGRDSCDSGWKVPACFCEHDNEPSSSVKGWQFID